jgi:CHAT domain-containing protein
MFLIPLLLLTAIAIQPPQRFLREPNHLPNLDLRNQHKKDRLAQKIPSLYQSTCTSKETAKIKSDPSLAQNLKDAQQELDFAQRFGQPVLLAGAFRDVGNAYLELQQYNLAIAQYQQAIEAAKQVNNLEFQGLSFFQMGVAYQQQCQYEKAIAAYQQAVSLHQSNQDRFASAYALAQLGLVQLKDNRSPQAAQSFEKAVENFESIRTGLPDRFKISVFRMQSLVYQMFQYALVLNRKNDTALEIAERGRARAFVELLGQRVQGAPKLESPKLAQIQEIAKAQNATLVEYSLIREIDEKSEGGKDYAVLLIWVVKPTGETTLRHVDLTRLSEPLPQIVEKTRNSIFQSTTEPINPALQRLHQILVEPIADLLPTDPNQHVVFIPQDALFLVPFAALQDAQGRYLVERHTIRTSPAIQVLDLTRRQRQRLQGNGALVVGFPRSGLIVGNPAGIIPELPEAEKEAIEIATLLQTKPILGQQATKAAILSALPKAQTIHLATHGRFEDRRSEGLQSSLSFAVIGQDKGLLTANEIIDLKLNASFAALSACNSGRGEITGDGVVGLSRAFIAAGVPSLLISLWSLNDQPSVTSLMVRFYKNLQQNPDRAQALRQTMLSTLKQHPHPKDWAAFTIIGEAQ